MRMLYVSMNKCGMNVKILISLRPLPYNIFVNGNTKFEFEFLNMKLY